MTTNLNAIQSPSTKKSVDFDATYEQSSNLTSVEQKHIPFYVDNLIKMESNHNDIKSVIKSSYQIPSRTILLPGEFSSSPKTMTNSNTLLNKIQRSSAMDSNRNLLTFNQPNSFHLKNFSIDHIEDDKISISSINSLNLYQPLSPSQISLSNTIITTQQLQTSHFEGLIIQKSSHNSISTSHHIFPPNQTAVILPRFVDKPVLSNKQSPSPRISLSQMVNDLDNNLTSSLSNDFESSSFKIYPNRIDNENTPVALANDISSFETSPQIKIRHEIKHEPESLWKTKLTLKMLLSMANRDEAQALKDRKPIDYHMFLTNKFDRNSILEYNDHIDTKFTANIEQSSVQLLNNQDYKENRKLYKRLLDTMELRKPINTKKTESITSMKKIKTKTTTKIRPSVTIPENSFQTFNDSVQYFENNQNEKPVLITYKAVPASIFNK